MKPSPKKTSLSAAVEIAAVAALAAAEAVAVMAAVIAVAVAATTTVINRISDTKLKETGSRRSFCFIYLYFIFRSHEQMGVDIADFSRSRVYARGLYRY
jgi:hypothetical protein